eukprot:g65380.t1
MSIFIWLLQLTITPTDSKLLVPLIQSIDDHFQVHEDGINFLRSLGDSLISLAAIAGEYRSGKSFLLNALLNQSQSDPDQGFKVSHDMAGCTKGMWLSTHTHTVQSEGAKPVTLLYMDTEGFGDIDKSEQSDPKLCFLAATLSTNLLYNSRGKLSLHNVRFLHTVAGLNNYMLKLNQTAPLGRLTWLLTDPQVEYPSIEQYLDHILTESTSANAEHRDKYNYIVRFVKNSYPAGHTQQRIFDIPQPADNTQQGSVGYKQLGWASYSAAYRDTLLRLQAFIASQAAPKRWGRRTLTGNSLAALLPDLVRQLNHINHVGDALVAQMARLLAQECQEDFLQGVEGTKPWPVSEQLLEQQMGSMSTDVTQKYDSNAPGLPSSDAVVFPRERLISNISAVSVVTRHENSASALQRCSELLKDQPERLQRAASNRSLSHADFQTLQQAAIEEFASHCDCQQARLRLLCESFQQQMVACRAHYARLQGQEQNEQGFSYAVLLLLLSYLCPPCLPSRLTQALPAVRACCLCVIFLCSPMLRVLLAQLCHLQLCHLQIYDMGNLCDAEVVERQLLELRMWLSLQM